MPSNHATASRRAFVATLAAAAPALAASLSPSRAAACARVTRSGPVHIDGEDALILWDDARRTQHFVRTALFAGATEDFGFLVPTPTRPTLGEADSAVFGRLFEIYRLRLPAARGIGGGDGSRGSRPTGRSAGPRVEVLERRQVAGMDATVLRANDTAALDTWLSTHRYPSGPELREWLRPYVEKGFIVTAFRYDPGAAPSAFASSAVRMSFRAERAFYPYAEPRTSAPWRPGRTLRLSVVAPFRVRAIEGDAQWRARVGYADQPGAPLQTALRRVAPMRIERDTWLTVFDDTNSRRGIDDLYFLRSDDQSQVAPSITTRVVQGGASRARPRPR